MEQSMLRGLIICSFVCCYVCLHVPFDLKGWKALPLGNTQAVQSMVLAAEHLGATLKKGVTAYQWIEDVPGWDLYRVSFISAFQGKNAYECHADVVWILKPANATVFNTGCLPAPFNAKDPSYATIKTG
ncbi:insoluble matrix shell protein 2-like [Mercenaria mercenaria]|uniref:insoluble matrix shell protein 2-like n=1 Tax=Mercenaria mercenaria TaxID=6596 RepID=UPI00234E42B1|nr:insoluble matrix shell protein 2-like [Mercenaria mercenaria]